MRVRNLLLAAAAAISCFAAFQGSASAYYTSIKLSTNGAWSFFGDPRAVHHEGKTYVGWTTNRSNVVIGSVNDGSKYVRTKRLKPNLGTLDDHNNPSLFLNPDGRLSAFYSPHSGTKLPLAEKPHIYYTTTTKPGEIDNWGKVREIPTNTSGGLGFTYPNPVQLANGKIFLAWRGGNWMPTYSIGDLSTNRWAKARSVTHIKGDGKFPPSRPYAKFAKGAKNSVLIAYNADHPSKIRTSLYFVRYRPGSGYYNAAGKKLAGAFSAVPTWKADVVQGWRAHGNTWVMDIAEDSEGRPVVLYTAGNQRTNPTVFWIARYQDGRWVRRKIVSSGYVTGGWHHPKLMGHYPTGGGTLDHDDPSNIYVSRVEGAKHRMHVEMWSMTDSEKFRSRWKVKRLSPRGGNCFRPADVRGSAPGNAVMMCGYYRDWRNFTTSVFLSTTP